jgi:GT2 family glycosyltransferase
MTTPSNPLSIAVGSNRALRIKSIKSVKSAVVIVNYKSSALLYNCLQSLATDCFETWVVDNGSNESLDKLRLDFPLVHWILNPQNLGFAKAVNQALRVASGRFFLLLNPDTRVEGGAVEEMADFLDKNPEVGIVGANVAGFDGKHEPASHRSIPTPATAFYRLSGLSRLFPDHREFAKYNLSKLDGDTGAYVEAVSGACMMLRRAMLDQIGLLDETFFLYGEDLDLCYRAGKADWKVYYLPEARIKHLKGGSSRRNRMRSHYEFYRAMAIFHRKHFAGSYGIFLNSIIYAGIWSRAVLTSPLLLKK